MPASVTHVVSGQPIGGLGVPTSVLPRPTVLPVVRHMVRAVGHPEVLEIPAVAARPSLPRLLLNAIGTFICAFVFSMVFLALIPIGGGFRPVVVASGSMAPALRTGDVVITQSVAEPPIVGSVIVYRSGERSLIHRVAAIDDGRYITKGDANQVRDSRPVDESEVEGIGVMLIPLIGMPKLWFEEARWLELALAIGVFTGACWVAPRRWLSRPEIDLDALRRGR